MPYPATARLLAACLAACWLGSCATPAEEPALLSAGRGVARVEIARGAEALQRGLMHRDSLAEDSGMLFAFPGPRRWCMWMKNTRIPLSVAFLDSSGAVINIAEMTPHSEVPHCSRRNASYALEMNRGWFARHGVAPGSAIRQCSGEPSGLPRAPARGCVSAAPASAPAPR